jgi:hypothetical protein
VAFPELSPLSDLIAHFQGEVPAEESQSSDRLGWPRQPPGRGMAPHIGPRITGSGRPLALYRIVKAREPTSEEFWSDSRAGLPAYGKAFEVRGLHDSAAFWTSAKHARDRAQDQPMLGDFVAHLVVPPRLAETTIAIHPTPDLRGHCDVWASPDVLAQLVRDVFPVHRR